MIEYRSLPGILCPFPSSPCSSSLINSASATIHHHLYLWGHMPFCTSMRWSYPSLLLTCSQTQEYRSDQIQRGKTAKQRLQRLQTADKQLTERNIKHSQSHHLIQLAQSPGKPGWLLPREKSQVRCTGLSQKKNVVTPTCAIHPK